MFDDELKIIRHMLAAIIECPYAFRTYTKVGPKTTHDPDRYGITFYKDDDRGVWAEVTRQYFGHLYVLRIKPTWKWKRSLPRVYEIILCDPETYDVVCKRIVDCGNDLSSYESFRNAAYAIMLQVHSMLAEYFDKYGVMDNPRNKEDS